MSEKSPLTPFSISASARFTEAHVDGPEQVGSYIRRIQADAEQICTDAVDIEDARFLAADILEVCRRFVTDAGNGGAASPAPGRVDDVTAQGQTAACNADSARARLERLSARELEIFTGLAEGHSAAEIASRLSRSTKTVNNHRTRILQKLGLRNSAELVRLALKCGVVSV